MVFVYREILQRGRFQTVEMPNGIDRTGLDHAANALFFRRAKYIESSLRVGFKNHGAGRMWIGEGGQVHDGFTSAHHLAQMGIVTDITRLVFHSRQVDFIADTDHFDRETADR
jgi:hypothetical protein